MLIIALVLAVMGLAALVFAVVTSTALVAWVCIAASALGVLVLIVDAIREHRSLAVGSAGTPESDGDAADIGDTGIADTAEPEASAEDTYENFDAEPEAEPDPQPDPESDDAERDNTAEITTGTAESVESVAYSSESSAEGDNDGRHAD